jgi:RNA polymerase sigma-70 factor, ECF subfamily
MSAVDDADLVRACCEGDGNAFAALLERYERPVYNAALRMLGDADDARDVAQTVFLKVYERIGDYDPRYRFYSWIYRIALNESINALKRRRQFVPIDDDLAAGLPGPEQTLADEQFASCVQAGLMSLQENYRTVIVLKHFLDMSYQQMSQILELPEKTVKSRLFSARQLLRDALRRGGAL